MLLKEYDVIYRFCLNIFRDMQIHVYILYMHSNSGH